MTSKINTDLHKPHTTLDIEPPTPPTGELPFVRQLDETDLEVRMGSWEVGLFGCLQTSMANSCMAWCLPCFPLAQISQRIGFAKYSTTLAILWGFYVAEWILYALGIYPRHLYHVPPEFDFKSSDTLWWFVDTFLYSSTNIASVTGLVIMHMTWELRHRVRTLLQIDGNVCEDCIWSVACACCAIAQMATQVKTYKKTACNFGPVDTLPAYTAA